MSEKNTIVVGNGFVNIFGEADENNLAISVQDDGTLKPDGTINTRLCIIHDNGGDLEVFDATPQGLATALKRLAETDEQDRKWQERNKH